MTADFDLLIVGAGLAGNCLALALRDSGLNIAVAETSSRRQLRDSPLGDRALALATGTVQLLQQLGAWQGIAARATPIERIHVSDRGHFGKTRLSAAEHGVAALGHVILARDIEEHLADLVAESGCCRLFYETRVAGLMSGQDAVNISLRQNAASLNLSTRLVVGADGGQSTIRKLLDIPQQITDYGQTALVTTVQSALPHLNTAYERFTPSGPLALLPVAGRDSAVVWTRSHEQAQDLALSSEAEFMEQLQQCFGYRLGELRLKAPVRTFPLSLIRADSMVSGRAVILGNAVHQLHPVAGQGFNLGIRDVAKLAQILRETTDPGNSSLLEAYARQRQRDHDRTIGFTNGLVRIFSTDNPPLSLLRNAGLTALDHLPAAKRLLTRHAMGLAETLSDNLPN